MDIIRNDLLSMKDEKYRTFTSKLIPNVKFDRIIGVRIPVLRNYAKSLPNDIKTQFMNKIPHEFHEENALHTFLIEDIKEFDECLSELNRFLPYIDNWSVCDSCSPKVFSKEKYKLLKNIDQWLASSHEYTVRFGIKMLMTHFLGDDFNAKYAQKVIDANRDNYYISMMTAWYFATALAKNYDECIIYLENRLLDKTTHNKAIQKSIESYRISEEQKVYLRSLKIK